MTARASVVVLSYNRTALLRRTLRSVLRQDLPGCEVIVVDNGSTDGAPEMVRLEFPSVRLLALGENLGIRGRNVGFRTASAPIVVSLDDDIELVSPRTLGRIVERFDADARIGALTLKICGADAEGGSDEYDPVHWWHPLPRELFQDREFLSDHFNEAAVAFRREALAAVGFYYEALFWGGEEWDLALGLMDAGYDIRYIPEPAAHLAPRRSLNQLADPRHALLVRNRCWIALRRLPLRAGLRFSIPRLVVWGFRSLRYGYVGHYLRGLGGLLRALPTILGDRAPIRPETYQRWRALQRQRPDPQVRILAVASAGGHWTQLRRVAAAFDGHPVAYLTTEGAFTEELGGSSPLYLVGDASRWDRWAVLVLALRVTRILWRLRPEVVISTGAAPGVFAIAAGKLLGARTIWLDSIANVQRISLSGRLVRPFCDLRLTQWPELARDGGPQYAGRVF